ncbi:hypothetical protein [Streptomyces sp. MST-110588]|uniref:hypothetical protein n=1 Tax=Streptomyces sp. MST-110588 TaxID=2833628 RepID=UPI001F5CD30C|nr:hypothetical protein [Streptomyces sp. MST-110588]UNO38392.1 hypothetical protein KGS77_00425 [Streptomyces sp. MST-110588]
MSVRTVRARVAPLREYGSTAGVIVLLNFLPMPLVGRRSAVAVSRKLLPLPGPPAVVGCCCLAATLLLGRRMSHHRDAPWWDEARNACSVHRRSASRQGPGVPRPYRRECSPHGPDRPSPLV